MSSIDRRTFLTGSCGFSTLFALGCSHPATRPASAGAMMTDDAEVRDVLIIGGGPAGLTAALYLGRARKSVLVLDRGNPRHAVSEGIHNFLTREGMPPSALRETAWEQMAAYPSVEHRATTVTKLERRGESWCAETDDGASVMTRAVLLATGVIDEHPQIPGYRERWGHSIHHCPFCHGWELRDLPLAVLAHGPAVEHFAPLLRNWSRDVVVLTHGQELPDPIRESLAKVGIPVYESPVESLEGSGRELEHIRLADGTTLDRRGLFVKSTQRPPDLIANLGVALDEHGYVTVDRMGSTSLPGVWAAGDLTSGHQQVIEAAAQGARAGAMIVMSLTMS
jgi:thioredoxin reductase